MSEKANNLRYSASDRACIAELGAFIRQHRLEQNRTQEQLSRQAGINRTTLLDLEKGNRMNLITFIQLLRALNLLHLLDVFKIIPRLSPIQLAEMEMKKRKRASKTKRSTKKDKLNW